MMIKISFGNWRRVRLGEWLKSGVWKVFVFHAIIPALNHFW